MAVAARATSDNAPLGIGMILAAYLFFACIDTSVKWLTLSGLAALQLSFMRYLGHGIISTALIGRGGWTWERFQTTHLGWVLLRTYLLVASTAFNFIALTYLPLSITSAIMFSAPVIVCVLAWPMLGERVGPWRWFAICLGFAGVLIVIRPGGAAFHWAMLLSLHNAAALALYSIITRKLSGVVAAETMQVYMGVIGTLVLLPFAVWTWVWPETLLEWALMVGLGFWGWAGHEVYTRAHSYAPANALMPYTYSFMLYLTLAGVVVFGHVPDAATLVGAGVIVVSGLIIWKRRQVAGG
ncbi:DMT family transporter [Pseudaestuariivita sp.]|uniref:DMT family transporter n=1 Tax=Pseudaestuariivita sp. TaxID=2211669 RepID=UPI004058FA9D